MNIHDIKIIAKKIAQYIPRMYDKELFGYAGNLSFHTMLSIFPILMVSLGIFMQLGSFNQYSEALKGFIVKNFLPTHQEVLTEYMEQFLHNSIGLNITGFAAVFITSVMFFNNFEYIVCKLSNSEKRRFFSSLSTYWTLMTLSPLGLCGALYVSTVLQSKWQISHFADIFPYLIVWAIFSITYAVAINRKIAAHAIIAAAFASSICWWILKILFVAYVGYNKTYINLYGSFSVLFFFLLWIYVSWVLFLHGVKLCVLLDRSKGQQDIPDDDEQLVISNEQ